MASRYHLTPAGPLPCTATVRACPIGGEHFATQQEAEVGFQKVFGHNALPAGVRRVTLPTVELTGRVRFTRGYWGTEAPAQALAPILSAWREAEGLRALELEEYKESVRGKDYHMTVVGPRDLKKSVRLPEATVTFTTGGVGRVSSGTDEAVFILCTSSEAQEFRRAADLPPKDLHITIGFKTKDIHNVPKDKSTLILI